MLLQGGEKMTRIDGKKIAGLRKNREITQKQLAIAVSTSQQNVSYIELGARQANLDILQRIAAYFDCKVDDLLIPPQAEDIA